MVGGPAQYASTPACVVAWPWQSIVSDMANSDLFVRSASWLASLARAGGDPARSDRYLVALVGWYERSGGAVVASPLPPSSSATR
jgi:hypothetical protein